MSKQLGKEYADIEERKQFLRDNCDAAEPMGYMRRFTPDQIVEMKNELSEISIEINDVEDEKREMMTHFKARLDPLNDQRKNLLSNIKNNAVYVKETCYKFMDHSIRMVEYYNADGDLVSERPMMPQEMQKTVFQIDRTGTNN